MNNFTQSGLESERGGRQREAARSAGRRGAARSRGPQALSTHCPAGEPVLYWGEARGGPWPRKPPVECAHFLSRPINFSVTQRPLCLKSSEPPVLKPTVFVSKYSFTTKQAPKASCINDKLCTMRTAPQTARPRKQRGLASRPATGVSSPPRPGPRSVCPPRPPGAPAVTGPGRASLSVPFTRTGDAHRCRHPT